MEFSKLILQYWHWIIVIVVNFLVGIGIALGMQIIELLFNFIKAKIKE